MHDVTEIEGVGTIRPARGEDVGAITSIYNEAIVDGSYATADVEPVSVESRLEFMRSRRDPYGVFVVEQPGGSVIGWSALGPLAIRPSYSELVEPAVYLGSSHRAHRLGTHLLAHLLEAARRRGFVTMVAVIYARNAASRQGLLRAGFSVAVTIPEVTQLRKEWETVEFLTLRLQPEGAP